MNTKSCIIFSCSIFDTTRLFVLHQFMQTFKKHYSDCDIYIGINPGSVPNVINIIDSYNLNTIIEHVPIHMYSESDASGYQSALHKLLLSNKTYANYWFVHTKSGVNSHSDYLRDWYNNVFLSDRNTIEDFLSQYTDIGSYGMLGVEFDKNREYSERDSGFDIIKNTITSNLPCTHANFFYLHSIYVITHKSIELFLKLANTNDWFNTKLDRYYFEGIFPFIVSRSGSYPYIANQLSCNGVDLKILMADWITDNNLLQYNKYNDMYKKNYNFHQLRPPLC